MMQRPVRSLLAVVVLLAAISVAAADPIPQEPESRFQQARVDGQAGNLDDALRILSSLRAEYAHNVDYALARAQVLAQQGNDDAALADLREAVVLAPEYEEVWQLRYRLLSRQRDSGARSERDAVLREVGVRFPDAAWWQSPQDDRASHWTVLVGASHENLSGGLPAWNRQFIELTRDLESSGRYRAGVARNQRFDSSDVTLSLGGDTFFAEDWSAGLTFAFADHAEFQPQLSYAASLGKSFHGGWAGTLRYQHREYQTAKVTTAIAIVEKYLGDFRIAYTLGLSRLQDGPGSASHGLALNWYYNDDASVGISLHSGDEVESIGPGLVLKTAVRGAALTGRHKISERYSLLWWLGLHDQGDFYRRQYFGMAVSIRL